jgi:hypothetical protein
VRPLSLPLAAVVALSLVVSAVNAASAVAENVGGASGAVRSQQIGPHSAALRDAPGVVVARDVSFPQCGGSLPAEAVSDFGVLGTNNGISFTRNPCLLHQLAWAKSLSMPPAFYANTGNPGPVRAKHWPLGQTSPFACAASDPNSVGCSYDYGWNAAWQSYSTAVDAAQRLHQVDRFDARRRAANVAWWLDVETMNSWQTIDGPPTRAAQRRDVATIQGELDALRFAGVIQVGIYSTRFQWGQITGGASLTQGKFAGVPQWLAGYESQSGAVAGCGDAGFTGGTVRMTQYLGADGFDANVVCGGAGV